MLWNLSEIKVGMLLRTKQKHYKTLVCSCSYQCYCFYCYYNNNMIFFASKFIKRFKQRFQTKRLAFEKLWRKNITLTANIYTVTLTSTNHVGHIFVYIFKGNPTLVFVVVMIFCSWQLLLQFNDLHKMQQILTFSTNYTLF